jgi:hypothetical protein
MVGRKHNDAEQSKAAAVCCVMGHSESHSTVFYLYARTFIGRSFYVMKHD